MESTLEKKVKQYSGIQSYENYHIFIRYIIDIIYDLTGNA